MYLKIVPNKFFENRTSKYLVPALNYYGSTFRQKFSQTFKLGVGIFDESLKGVPLLEGQRNLFLLFNSSLYPNQFISFLNWIKNQSYYVTDYSLEDIVTKIHHKYHMVVIEFPLHLSDSYDKFKEGKYSVMYDQKDIERYFSPELKKGARQVFFKTKEAKDEYIKKIKEEYDTVLTYQDLLENNCELDFPYKEEEEIFLINNL